MREAGPAGFVRHGVEGLLAADDADLARQLTTLVTDDALRARIMRHNRDTQPAETWPVVLAQHERLYAEARAGHGVRVPAARATVAHGPLSALLEGPTRAGIGAVRERGRARARR